MPAASGESTGIITIPCNVPDQTHVSSSLLIIAFREFHSRILVAPCLQTFTPKKEQTHHRWSAVAFPCGTTAEGKYPNSFIQLSKCSLEKIRIVQSFDFNMIAQVLWEWLYKVFTTFAIMFYNVSCTSELCCCVQIGLSKANEVFLCFMIGQI